MIRYGISDGQRVNGSIYQLFGGVGLSDGVENPDDLMVSVTGNNEVTISTGRARIAGITAQSTTTTTINLTDYAAGTWYITLAWYESTHNCTFYVMGGINEAGIDTLPLAKIDKDERGTILLTDLRQCANTVTSGNWTPHLAHPNATTTIGASRGLYTKVGRLVRLFFTIGGTYDTDGVIIIDGLPYAVGSVTGNNGVSCVGIANLVGGFSIDSGLVNITCQNAPFTITASNNAAATNPNSLSVSANCATDRVSSGNLTMEMFNVKARAGGITIWGSCEYYTNGTRLI